MKKYMLFTKDSIEEYYHVFQGDYESLGIAYRKVGCMAQNSGKLCVYRIIKWDPNALASNQVDFFRKKVMRCVAEGFVRGDLSSDLKFEACPSEDLILAGVTKVEEKKIITPSRQERKEELIYE